MGSENRKFTRFYYRMNSELSVNGCIYKIEELINLSIGGCLLPTSVTANTGDKCLLKIMLGDNDEAPVVSVEGKIVRIDDITSAIVFTKIDPESLDHLHSIALYNASDPKKVEQEIKKHPGLF